MAFEREGQHLLLEHLLELLDPLWPLDNVVLLEQRGREFDVVLRQVQATVFGHVILVEIRGTDSEPLDVGRGQVG